VEARNAYFRLEGATVWIARVVAGLLVVLVIAVLGSALLYGLIAVIEAVA
jgi:hypothetical protein